MKMARKKLNFFAALKCVLNYLAHAVSSWYLRN
jgi:hypothetical protein